MSGLQFTISQHVLFSINSLTPALLTAYTRLALHFNWSRYSNSLHSILADNGYGCLKLLFMLTSLFFSENLCLCLFHDSFSVYLDSCWSLSYVWCVQHPYSFLQTAVSPLMLTACLPF